MTESTSLILDYHYLVFKFSVKSKLVFWFTIRDFIQSEPVNRSLKVTWFVLLNIINICRLNKKERKGPVIFYSQFL